jgi:alanine dehydrogenase
VLQIADKGYEKAFEENEALRKGLNLIDGKVVCLGVAESFGMPYIKNPFEKV